MVMLLDVYLVNNGIHFVSVWDSALNVHEVHSEYSDESIDVIKNVFMSIQGNLIIINLFDLQSIEEIYTIVDIIDRVGER